jgi:hypothetical protein
MSPRTAKSKKAPKGKTGKQQVLPPAKPLDVKAAGKEIGRMVASVDKAAAAYDTAATPLQERLIEIALHHPKQLKEVLKHTGLGRSRTAELLAVAEGRTTLKQIRVDNAERQRRSRATKKAKAALPAPKSVTVTDKDKATTNNGNDRDPEETADERRAAHAAAEADEADTETEPTPTPRPRASPRLEPLKRKPRRRSLKRRKSPRTRTSPSRRRGDRGRGSRSRWSVLRTRRWRNCGSPSMCGCRRSPARKIDRPRSPTSTTRFC